MNINTKPTNNSAQFKAKILQGAIEFLRNAELDSKKIFASTWQRARRNAEFWSEVSAPNVQHQL